MDKSWVSLLRSYKSILLVSILVIVSFAVSYAYFRSLNPLNVTRAKTISWPLEFYIELNKTTFVQHENVSILVGLRNASNETVNATWFQNSVSHSQWMFFDFFVMDENGTAVFSYYGTHGRTDGTWERTLTPGQQLTVIYPWSTRDLGDALVPKGNYFVKALTRQIRLTVGNNSTFITLETPTISIVIS